MKNRIIRFLSLGILLCWLSLFSAFEKSWVHHFYCPLEEKNFVLNAFGEIEEYASGIRDQLNTYRELFNGKRAE